MNIKQFYMSPILLLLLSVTASALSMTEASPQSFSKTPDLIPLTLCPHDINQVRAARESMSLGQYAQVIEISNPVIKCPGGLAVQTLVDIYKIRGESFYHLYLEEGDLKGGSKKLISALTQYKIIYGLLEQYEVTLSVNTQGYLQESLTTVVVDAYNWALSLQSQGMKVEAVAYFEAVVIVLGDVKFAVLDKSAVQMQAISGYYSGYFYLKQKNRLKAKRYLALAMPIQHAYLSMSQSVLKDHIPLASQRASQLYFNLGGLYYKELIEQLVAMDSGEVKSTKKTRKNLSNLVSLADACFHLSATLNPGDLAVVNTMTSLDGFKKRFKGW